VMAIFDRPTVAALAEYVLERHAGAVRRLLGGGVEGAWAGAVPGRGVLLSLEEGEPDRRPLFCVHPIGGEVVAYRELARHLGGGVPVYGVQSPDPPIDDLREMAAHYLAAIREVQPAGPYRLLGWSMGGIAAYEMARQLAEREETVEVLALLDALSPKHFTGGAELGETDMVAIFASGIAWLHGLEVSSVDLSGLDQDAALALVLDLGRQAGLVPPDLELAELRRLFERFRANHYALYTYEPGPYAGEVILFRGAESRQRDEDPTLGWGGLVSGPLRVLDLPGGHYTILREEVETLAGRLRTLLG